MRQRMDHREPLVAGCQAAPASLLQVLKELTDVFGIEVTDVELIDLLAGLVSDEWDEQSQCVAVTALRIPREITLAHEVFEEKAPHPWAEF
jgi:hypothetical protein